MTVGERDAPGGARPDASDAPGEHEERAMPEAAAQAHTDPDYPITPVPRHARRSMFSLLMVLLGFTFFVPTMLAGAQVGEAFSFGRFLGILVAGSLVLGIYVALLGTIGARTGLTTVLMSRYALGRVGAKGASLLLGGAQVGWYGVAAASLANLAAQAFGWDSRVRRRRGDRVGEQRVAVGRRRDQRCTGGPGGCVDLRRAAARPPRWAGPEANRKEIG